MVKTILKECMEIIMDLVGHECLYFDQAVEIKITPHSPTLLVWAVVVSPNDELFVMDGNETWHQVSINDQNAMLLIGSLYQRLKMMRINYAKAS